MASIVKYSGVLFVLFAVLSAPLWAQPPAGFIGFPTIDGGDGRFFAFTRGSSSLGDFPGTVVALSICVDGSETDLSVWLHDGEVGGLWDQPGPDTMTWELYPDPTLSGNTTGALESVPAAGLTDDGWEEIINRTLDASALAADGNYYYHLVGIWDTEPPNINMAQRAKVAANGNVFLLPGSTIGFVGFALFGTTYDGTFLFSANFPFDGSIPCNLTIFDGDADHGDNDTGFDDNDPTYGPGDIPGDSGIPPFPTSPQTNAEGVNLSDPPDDLGVPAIEIEPDVFFTVTGPGASYVHPVPNPSGDQEWERTVIWSLDSNCPQVPPAAPPFVDLFVADLLPGAHDILFEGLDTGNTIFLNIQQATVGAPDFPEDECGPGKKVRELFFQYTGDDCSGSDHDQGGDASCSGDPGSSPVSIDITKKESKRTASPDSGISEGAVVHFTTTNDWFKGDLEFDVNGASGSGTQSLSLHVSCSEPLAVGDQFGSMLLVGLVAN